MLFIISWRNVWRNKLRSLLIMGAIAFGLWGGIVSIALMLGMVDQRMTATIETRISHIQIHHEKFMENKEMKYLLPDSLHVLETVQNEASIKAAAGRLVVTGMASSAANGTGAEINGIDPAQEKQVTNLYTKLVEGDYFETQTRNPVIIGQSLAERLKIKLKSKVVLTMQSKEGDITAGAFRVVGIFKTSSTPFDEGNVFVLRSDLERIVGLPNQLHEIAIVLDDFEQAETVANTLNQQWPHLAVDTWRELAPDLEYMIEMMDQSAMIFLGVILIGMLFGIVNTMLMAVLERVRELGMLMAVGMNKLRVFVMIVLETIYLAITGGAVGLLLGALTVQYLGQVGLDLSFAADGLESYGYDSIIYTKMTLEYYVMLSGMVIVMAVFAALYPARKALKLNPATAIRTL